VIEGEALTSGGERPVKGPMICGGEFSEDILLLFFFTHRCFGVSWRGSWLWRPNVVVLLIGKGEDEGEQCQLFIGRVEETKGVEGGGLHNDRKQ
jgi:hypothetical protein